MWVGVGQEARTQVRRKTLDPVYNEAFLMEFSMETTTMHLTVFDWDPPDTEQEIGRLTIAIDKMEEDVTMCQWHDLWMGSIHAGAILLLTRLHKKAGQPSPGYLIQSTHVSKEHVPGRTHRDAQIRRERKQARLKPAHAPQAALLDDHTLLTQGECTSHTRQMKKERSTNYGLHAWQRSRGFLWKARLCGV